MIVYICQIIQLYTFFVVNLNINKFDFKKYSFLLFCVAIIPKLFLWIMSLYLFYY